MAKKLAASPARSMMSAAIAGPTIRAMLKTTELSAEALSKSSAPTMSKISDCRTGRSSALMRPATSASQKMFQKVARPVTTRTPSAKAWSADRLWVTIATRRLSSRSAPAPASSEKKSEGNVSIAVTTPSKNGEFVMRTTSQPTATICIQVPMREKICPEK